MLFLIIDGDDGKVSQLALRMVLKALRCLKPSGGDVTRTVFCGIGYVGRRSGILLHRRPCFLLYSPCLWRMLFLLLELEGSALTLPQAFRERLAPKLASSPLFALVPGFALGTTYTLL